MTSKSIHIIVPVAHDSVPFVGSARTVLDRVSRPRFQMLQQNLPSFRGCHVRGEETGNRLAQPGVEAEQLDEHQDFAEQSAWEHTCYTGKALMLLPVLTHHLRHRTVFYRLIRCV